MKLRNIIPLIPIIGIIYILYFSSIYWEKLYDKDYVLWKKGWGDYTFGNNFIYIMSIFSQVFSILLIIANLKIL